MGQVKMEILTIRNGGGGWEKRWDGELGNKETFPQVVEADRYGPTSREGVGKPSRSRLRRNELSIAKETPVIPRSATELEG